MVFLSVAAYHRNLNKIKRGSEVLTKAAQYGHPEAIRRVGDLKWKDGEYDDAALCFEKAAMAGIPEAIYALGRV